MLVNEETLKTRTNRWMDFEERSRTNGLLDDV